LAAISRDRKGLGFPDLTRKIQAASACCRLADGLLDPHSCSTAKVSSMHALVFAPKPHHRVSLCQQLLRDLKVPSDAQPTAKRTAAGRIRQHLHVDTETRDRSL
jgi:hypothetical protein